MTKGTHVTKDHSISGHARGDYNLDLVMRHRVG